MNIGAIIMASGKSERMGANKLFLEYKGKTMLEHSIDTALAAGLSQVVVVTAYADKVSALVNGRKGVCVISNMHQERGISESIRLGVEHLAECDAYIFFVGDQPYLTAATVRQLVSLAARDLIVVPEYGARRGNPVIFGADFSAELLALSGDKGGSQIMKKYPERIKRIQIADTRQGKDIDTREEYEMLKIKEQAVIVRGGGDIATGTAAKLHNCGFQVLILECEKPSSIRNTVCFGTAVYEGAVTIEDITARKIDQTAEADAVWSEGEIPVLVDPNGTSIQEVKPLAVVDGILAKRNLGTSRKMAPITIGLGPGFTAGVDVDAVIETNRGHDLGRIIWQGAARPNTGIPGNIGGYTSERVVYSPADGQLLPVCQIGDIVRQGEIIAVVGGEMIQAPIDGVLRGLIQSGYEVKKGLKIADVDPRSEEQKNCFTISDKARCIAGGVVEALLICRRNRCK